MNASLRAAVYALRRALRYVSRAAPVIAIEATTSPWVSTTTTETGPDAALEHGGDDGEGLVVGHFDEKKGARAPSRKGCESIARPPENGNCNATRTTSAKPMMTAIAPAPIAWNAELFEPTSVA